ncbi:MAG: hypothetical protein IIY81_07615 [Lachnospiraceae bacterium]|nr:hypothetical protein [Lachnospiraceae bacterium]
MIQKGTATCEEKDKLRQELFILLSEGIDKDGKSNPMGMEVLYCNNPACERTGLYY